MNDDLTTLPTATAGRTPPWRMVLAAAVVLAVPFLMWKSWQVNITMSCWKDEWPHLKVCDEINGVTVPEKIERLKERLARNPGDAQALTALLVYSFQEGMATDEERKALLARAMKAAPQATDVLHIQSNEALKRQDWPGLLDPLIRLARFHRSDEARTLLAQLVATAPQDGRLQSALEQAADADPAWIPLAIRAMPKSKIAVTTALPLLSRLIGQGPGRLEPTDAQYMIGQLKAERRWLEAHALWLYMWQKPLPLVFNGEFEGNFVRGGFDWETPSSTNDHRNGAQVDQLVRKDHGRVLRVSFNGKAFRAPIVRQQLVAPPGHYRLSTQWQSTDLRSEHGLAWSLTCLSDQRLDAEGKLIGQPRELAWIEGLKPEGRDWKTAQAEFDVPPDCGMVLELALRPQAAFEARTGLRGDIVLDNVRIERLADTTPFKPGIVDLSRPATAPQSQEGTRTP